jgi:hypothetical protein
MAVDNCGSEQPCELVWLNGGEDMYIITKCSTCKETKTLEATYVDGELYDDKRDRWGAVFICCNKKQTVMAFDKKVRRINGN